MEDGIGLEDLEEEEEGMSRMEEEDYLEEEDNLWEEEEIEEEEEEVLSKLDINYDGDIMNIKDYILFCSL